LALDLILQHFETTIFFRCPGCGAADFIGIEVPEFDFTSDRMSDHVSEGTVYFDCPNCEREFEAEAFCNAAGCKITLAEYNKLSFDGDSPLYSTDDDYWESYDPPSDPYSVFKASVEGLEKLLNTEISIWGDGQLINRMIFSNAIASLEYYLSDKVLRDVIDSDKLILKLIDRDKHLSQEKLTILEVATNSSAAKDKVSSHLKKILYHNLERVKVLYGIVYGIDLSVDRDDWNFLLKAVIYRHDCVHRNGRDKDANLLDVFSKPFVIETMDIAKRLVSRIEEDAGWGDEF
jgi:predicted RNA-binding Zn-ribbon protein involved in translation (DUF1610 family)